MCFEYTLLAEPSDREKEVGKKGLNPRVQMQFRLLENQRRVRFRKQAGNQDR